MNEVQRSIIRSRLRVALHEARKFPSEKELFSCLSLYTNLIISAETFLTWFQEGMVETLGIQFQVVFAPDITRGKLLEKVKREDFSRRLGKTVAIEKTMLELEFRKPLDSWALHPTVFVSFWKI